MACCFHGITNIGDVVFYKLLELISSQATLVNSQTPKKDTPRKVNVAQTVSSMKHQKLGLDVSCINVGFHMSLVGLL
jgi:hypothetical protein